MKITSINEKLTRLGLLGSISKKSTICMESNTELSVYRCKSLIEYSTEEIKLSLCDGVLIVLGNNLGLKTFSNTEITISGRITEIRFEDGKHE